MPKIIVKDSPNTPPPAILRGPSGQSARDDETDGSRTALVDTDQIPKKDSDRTISTPSPGASTPSLQANSTLLGVSTTSLEASATSLEASATSLEASITSSEGSTTSSERSLTSPQARTPPLEASSSTHSSPSTSGPTTPGPSTPDPPTQPPSPIITHPHALRRHHAMFFDWPYQSKSTSGTLADDREEGGSRSGGRKQLKRQRSEEVCSTENPVAPSVSDEERVDPSPPKRRKLSALTAVKRKFAPSRLPGVSRSPRHHTPPRQQTSFPTPPSTPEPRRLRPRKPKRL